MSSLFDFLHSMIGERPIEIGAVMLGIANITLLIRRSIWNYPFGIVMVSLYAWIFFREKLYSDTLLQIFFFVVQFYGWWYWLQGRDDEGHVIVRIMSKAQKLSYTAAGVVGVAALGTAMARYTDAAYPYWDASIAVCSVIAQILLARRRLENWLVWVGVDMLAVGLYWAKALYPTAALYFLFLILAWLGHVAWRRAYNTGETIEP